jgi:type IV pilus assembly protein PilC
MDTNGKEKKGKISAENEDAATSELKLQGLFITSLKNADPKAAKAEKAGVKSAAKSAAKASAKKRGGGGMVIGTPKIKKKELMVITRQLATLLDAGLPLIRSLRTLERQAKNPLTKRVLGETADTVEGGSTFAEALAQHPQSFDKLYLNMVRAGEASGAMEIILSRLASFMEKASV